MSKSILITEIVELLEKYSEEELLELKGKLIVKQEVVKDEEVAAPETPVKSRPDNNSSLSPIDNSSKRLTKRGKGIYLFCNVEKVFESRAEVLAELNKATDLLYTDILERCMSSLTRWVSHAHVKMYFVGRTSCPSGSNLWVGMMSRFNDKYKNVKGKEYKHIICLNIGKGPDGKEITNQLEQDLSKYSMINYDGKFQVRRGKYYSGAPANDLEDTLHMVYIACYCYL